MRKTHSFYFIFFSSFRLSLLRSVFGEYFIWTVFLFSYAGYLRNYSYQKKYLNYKNVSLFECCVFISYGSMKIQHFLPALILCRHQLIFPYFFLLLLRFLLIQCREGSQSYQYLSGEKSKICYRGSCLQKENSS